MFSTLYDNFFPEQISVLMFLLKIKDWCCSYIKAAQILKYKFGFAEIRSNFNIGPSFFGMCGKVGDKGVKSNCNSFWYTLYN